MISFSNEGLALWALVFHPSTHHESFQSIRRNFMFMVKFINKCTNWHFTHNQIISYGGVHTRTMLLTDVKVCDSLRPGQHRHWKDFLLEVPSLCPSRLHMCKVLDLRYCVAVSIPEVCIDFAYIFKTIDIVYDMTKVHLYQGGGWARVSVQTF